MTALSSSMVFEDATVFPYASVACPHGGRVEEVPATRRDRMEGASRFRNLSWLPHYLRGRLGAAEALAIRRPRKFRRSAGGEMERATGIEPTTSSLGNLFEGLSYGLLLSRTECHRGSENQRQH